MSKKRAIISFSLIIGVAIALVAIKLVSSALNMPAQGTISTQSSKQAVQTGINLTPKPITGKYASFNYPAGLAQTANSKITAPVVAMYNFSYHDIESWNLAIEILTVPSGQLNDNNSYQFRKVNPDTYQESHLVLNNQAFDVMTDKTVGGFSKVAFLVHGQYQATVSLYGDDPSGTGDLQTTLNMILKTWHWQAS